MPGDDPLAVARFLLTADLDAVAADHFRWQTSLPAGLAGSVPVSLPGPTPADLWDRLTARQVLALFFAPPPAERKSNLQLAAEVNRERAAQGLAPIVPGWLFPNVPRAKR